MHTYLLCASHSLMFTCHYKQSSWVCDCLVFLKAAYMSIHHVILYLLLSAAPSMLPNPVLPHAHPAGQHSLPSLPHSLYTPHPAPGVPLSSGPSLSSRINSPKPTPGPSPSSQVFSHKHNSQTREPSIIPRGTVFQSFISTMSDRS